MTTGTKCNPSRTQSYLERKTLMQLKKIEKGEITWNNQAKIKFGEPYKNLKAEVTIHNDSFYNKFIWRGSLGAAESYMDGDWSCDNLTQLMQIIIENESVLANLEKGWPFAGYALRILKNIVSYSHIKKSKKNILYHYDLSNEFFKLFLDKKMLYSCAIFDDDHRDLDQAQDRKLSHICKKLKLTKEDHLLEIGSGWGALAIYAAQKYQCKVTTTTISDAQYNYVYKKINDLNLKDRIFLLKKDYRQLEGQYDKLVSIEMIESIGYKYFKKYFSVCDHLLMPGGLFLLQSITINDQEYDRYKREVDFIKAYIFPGGCIPCIETISSAVKYNTSMRIKEIKDIGKDYAKTLSHWNVRFQKNLNKITALGFDEKFTRMFEFYFCYCEAAFLSSYISDIHVVMEKKMLTIVFHIICYYIVWFTCILSASHDYYWLGFITSVFFTSIQYAIQVKAKRSRHLLLLMGCLTVVGFSIDTIFAKYNLLTFEANHFQSNLSPPWMIALWINFSIVLYACFKKYFLKYKLLALLSLFGFPLAYYAGVSLGAASLPSGYIGLLFIGIIWSIALPSILYLYERLLWSHNDD